MKFTLSWLKDHLETDASLDDICNKLTEIGLEVEGVENLSESLAAFKVADLQNLMNSGGTCYHDGDWFDDACGSEDHCSATQ